MLTPQNFREKTFERAVFGGYDMAAVDDFLEEAANDYAAVAKDNMVLKSKMKVLVDKIEEYRSTEDSMRMTLLSAQKLCAQMEQESREKADALIANARLEAERIVRSAHDQKVTEEARLLEAKKESTKYIEEMHIICSKQLEFLENLESYKIDLSKLPASEPSYHAPAEPEPPAEEAPQEAAPIVEETMRGVESSVEQMEMDMPDDGSGEEIARVVNDGAAPNQAGDEPTRMYRGPQRSETRISMDNLRVGK